MSPILTGRTICLHPVTIQDAPCVQSRFPHWEIVKFLGEQVPWPYPGDGAVQHISNVILPAMQKGSEHHWGIRLQDGGTTLVGVVSLLPQDGSGNQRGFWISQEHQGRGLMFEAVELVTWFAFEQLGLEQLQLSNAEPNTPSIRLKEKQGAVLIQTQPGRFVSGLHQQQYWILTRSAWRNRSTLMRNA